MITKLHLIFFISMAIVFSNCKESNDTPAQVSERKTEENAGSFEGHGYTYNTICLYDDPKWQNPCPKEIPEGSKVTLLEAFVGLKEGGDPDRDSWYFKVKWDGHEGYIMDNEETGGNKWFASIQTIKPLNAKVTLNILNVRESPSLKAETLYTLKKKAEVQVIGIGLIKFTTDGVHDTWAQVLTKDGKIGYAFAGFLNGEGLLEKIGEGEKGFVIIKGKPETIQDIKNFQPTPEWIQKMESNANAKCEDDCEIYPYSRKLVKDGKTYLFIRKEFITYEFQSIEYGDLIEGWIATDIAKEIGRDLLNHSKKKEKDRKKLAIIEFLNRKERVIHHVDDIKLKKTFTDLEPDTLFHVIHYNTRDENLNIKSDTDTLNYDTMVLEKNGQFQVLDISFDEHIEPIDINKDGIYEWMAYASERNGYSQTILSSIDGNYKTIAMIEDDVGECNFYPLVDYGNPEMDKKKISSTDYVDHNGNNLCKFKIENDRIKVLLGKKIVEYQYDGKNLIQL